MIDQAVVFIVLIVALALFAWGRWRHDLVAVLALLGVTLTGVIEPARAFGGFGHDAVITVACVLVLSYALANSGLVDLLSNAFARIGSSMWRQLVVLTTLVTALSAFMNNIGALALVMPVAIGIARRNGGSASLLLMPLAFCSLLGGLITAIGTPPNIIIATFRADATGTPFAMFDFTPVGIGIALSCLLFIWIVGWRLVPQRETQGSREELFEIKGYLTELVVPQGNAWVGRYAHELEQAVVAEVIVGGVVRNERMLPASSPYVGLRAEDVVLVEADAKALQELMDATGLELATDQKIAEDFLVSRAMGVAEAVVTRNSPLIGQTAGSLDLRRRYGINLLAVSRQGHRVQRRLQQVAFESGDVLLVVGDEQRLNQVLGQLGCLPLERRGLRIGNPRRVLLATSIFGAAIATAALGFFPISVTFMAATVVMVVVGLVTPRDIYTAVDWPIIVLLGAMIPVGIALEVSGAAQLIASTLLSQGTWMTPTIAMALLLVITMTLSDVVNNAAAAVLMAPIALALAAGLQSSPDPFLMAVGVAASAAFLTPIGHQSNVLVMGPGGYRFSDYWRLGLPVQIVFAAVAIVLIPRIWPFHP